jgi:hypothetical protein
MPWEWVKKNAVKSCFVFLVLEIVIVCAYHYQQTDFRFGGDSQSYIRAAHLSLIEGLSLYRTLGYPLLLKAVDWLSLDYNFVYFIQLLFLGISLGCLFWSFVSLGLGPFTSMILSSLPLYLTPNQWPTVWDMVQAIEPDSMGMSFLIVSACLVVILTKSTKLSLWVALGISVTVAYHLKPIYLFLVFSVPLSGFLLNLILNRSTFSIAARYSSWLLLLTLIPFISFSMLRKITVGHFGLVSFGAFNLSGVTAQLLTEDMLPSLPDTIRPLASQIINQRNRPVKWLSPLAGSNQPWVSPRRADSALIDFERLSNQYNSTANVIVGKALVKAGYSIRTNAEANSIISEFNRAILKTSWKSYLHWVLSGFAFAWLYVIKANGIFLVVSLTLWGFLIALNRLATGKLSLIPQEETRTFACILSLALLTFLPNVFVMCMSGVPIPRYLNPAGFFLIYIPSFLVWTQVMELFKVKFFLQSPVQTN